MTTTDKTHSIGIWSGIISGLTYGIYTTLVMVAGYYEPLTLAVGLLAAPYVCSGLNDLFAGIWKILLRAVQIIDVCLVMLQREADSIKAIYVIV